jgi:CRAL/TRIO domain
MEAANTSVKYVSGGWPWMKDCPFYITETPIPPVHAADDRPLLVDLFVQHRTLMDQVATELQATEPLYNAQKHDDLWIVRFLLSHKLNVHKAIQAAKDTLLFRRTYKLDESDIRFAPPGPDVPNAALQRYIKYCAPDMFQIVVPDAKLGVVVFLDIAGFDQHGLVQNLHDDDWLPSSIYVAEFSHQWVDYLSRTTGRLTGSIRVVDASNLSLKSLNREWFRRDTKAMKVTENCFPQMLKMLFVCHGPSWIQAIWRLLRPLFPRRVVEKMDFIAPRTNDKERDRLLKYISLENLPARYGGKNDAWPLKFPPHVQ